MKQILQLFIIACLLSTIGCATKNNPNTQNDTKQQTIDFVRINNQSTDQKTSNEVKDILSQHKKVTEVSVVNNHQDIIAAVNVKPLSRFKLKKIEKKLEKKVKKQFSDKTVTLSTDKKIMIELKRVEKSMQRQHMSAEQLKEKMSHIKKLSKEQT